MVGEAAVKYEYGKWMLRLPRRLILDPAINIHKIVADQARDEGIELLHGPLEVLPFVSRTYHTVRISFPARKRRD
jgi:hypothetical protein